MIPPPLPLSLPEAKAEINEVLCVYVFVCFFSLKAFYFECVCVGIWKNGYQFDTILFQCWGLFIYVAFLEACSCSQPSVTSFPQEALLHSRE